MEQSLFDLVNADRHRNGLAGLAFDPDLLGVARERAEEQVDGFPLSHYDAAGELAFANMLDAEGVGYWLAGENLARAQGPRPPSPERIEAALMASPTHRRNILEPSFDYVAIAAVTDEAGLIAIAQIFIASE
jgi:uncharacterized protein YkwD